MDKDKKKKHKFLSKQNTMSMALFVVICILCIFYVKINTDLSEADRTQEMAEQSPVPVYTFSPAEPEEDKERAQEELLEGDAIPAVGVTANKKHASKKTKEADKEKKKTDKNAVEGTKNTTELAKEQASLSVASTKTGTKAKQQGNTTTSANTRVSNYGTNTVTAKPSTTAKPKATSAPKSTALPKSTNVPSQEQLDDGGSDTIVSSEEEDNYQ